MNQPAFNMEFLCALGGVNIECLADTIRAVAEDGSEVMEVALTPRLVASLRKVAEDTFPSDCQRVARALDAMENAGGAWVFVKSPRWWLDAFAENVHIWPKDYKAAITSPSAWVEAFEDYAGSFDYDATALDAFPTEADLEELRVDLYEGD
jgi:hypothetical protein